MEFCGAISMVTAVVYKKYVRKYVHVVNFGLFITCCWLFFVKLVASVHFKVHLQLKMKEVILDLCIVHFITVSSNYFLFCRSYLFISAQFTSQIK